MHKPVTNPIDYWWKRYLLEHEKVQELEKKLSEISQEK